MDNFWLDGESALDHGICCQGKIIFEAAEADVETTKIPGRNGDLVHWDGSYKNVSGSVECYCLSEDVTRAMNAINAWLMRSTEYRKLETMYDEGFYRLARLLHGARHEARKGLLNPFELEFDCRPGKFFKCSDINFSAATTLYNPSTFPAKPVITVHGSGAGTLTVNGYTLTLTDTNELVLDCEEQEATKNGTNANSSVSGTYPVLGQANEISFTGGIAGLTIQPRWWTL